MKKRRYSNFGSGMFEELPGSDDYTTLPSNFYNTTSTWTSQDTISVVNTGANLIDSVLRAIFGKSSTVLANSYYQQYEQEKRTNTILWVVLGLVLALGVFLVIRKTK